VKFKYNDGGKPVKLRERVGADCCVRALAISSETSYLGALTLCKRQGFEVGSGMDPRAYSVVLMRFGYTYEEAAPGESLSDVTGDGIADLNGHVVAIVDGRANDIFDTYNSPAADRLLGVWRRAQL